MKKLRIGIIGCGRIAVMHAVPATVLEEAELVACCDIVAERAEELAARYRCKAYTSYEKMIGECSLDAVHVCLPHYLHTVAAQYAMNTASTCLRKSPCPSITKARKRP